MVKEKGKRVAAADLPAQAGGSPVERPHPASGGEDVGRDEPLAGPANESEVA